MEPVTSVMVVDDSAFIRSVLQRLINGFDGFEVVAAARDGRDAIAQLERVGPDVITLDVEMPRMDGLETLRAIMAMRPTPVVMVSSLTTVGARTTIAALAAGAVDVVTKPSGPRSLDLHRVRGELEQKLRAAARARVGPRSAAAATAESRPAPPRPPVIPRAGRQQGLLLIGASTGGPTALQSFLAELPDDLSDAVVIVQHMPAGFTASLAAHLDANCKIPVREACDGDILQAGSAYVAPGGYHLQIEDGRRIRLNDDPPRHGVRPAVDVTLESIATDRHQSTPLTVVVLTGMGMDGAQGCYRLHQRGAVIMAQDEDSSVVYGMPRAVAKLGIAHHIGSPAELARHYLAGRQLPS